MSKLKLFLYSFKTTALYCFLVLSTILCIGCSSQGKQSSVAPTESASTLHKPQSPAATINQQKLKFRLNGVKAFALKPVADGMKLVDGNRKELAWLEVDAQQNIKIKNPSEQVVGYVLYSNGNWQVKSVDNTKIYILKQHSKENYKLEDEANQEIYEIKSRNDELEIETPNHQVLYQVTVKNQKILLKNMSNQSVLSTKSQIVPIAVACFGFDVLSPEQKAALAYAVKISGQQ